MKRILFLLLICISVSSVGHAQTQSDMNQDALKSYQDADGKLNAVYQQIVKQYSKNPLFLKNLKIAQRLWIQFRDAQLAMKYPDRPAGYYGSVFPMCQAFYLTELTNKRIKELEEWIVDRTDGDACGGTVGELEE